ncbi:MAG: cell division protein FtsL [Porticoccaceae bacterium]|jgi:cell division protein FtsL
MATLARRCLLVLWPLVLVSAIGVVYTSHLCRQLYTQLATLQREESRTQVEWGQYLLEQSTLASPGRIERAAVGELRMRVPEFNEVIMVEP